MRIDRFLLFVLLLASSYGCSEEQPYEVEKESVSIWEGDTRHVIIETDLTEHNYKLESENQEIATATLDEMGVCIATYKSGSTMIRLIDTDNKKITSLTLMYDNKTEKFGFKFATGMSYGYILQSDKTVEYQQRYPDAGITEVKVNYIWKDNGIIQLGGLTF